MNAIILLALARPYTFVVMAILIAITGMLSAIRDPHAAGYLSRDRNSRHCGGMDL